MLKNVLEADASEATARRVHLTEGVPEGSIVLRALRVRFCHYCSLLIQNGIEGQRRLHLQQAFRALLDPKRAEHEMPELRLQVTHVHIAAELRQS